jgi:hypothetical protein
MNQNELFDSRWEQIHEKTTQWWSLFGEEDLKKVEKEPVKRDKYIVMLQVKYGYTRDFARAELSRRIAQLEPMPVSTEPAVAPAKTKAKKTRVSKAKSRS